MHACTHDAVPFAGVAVAARSLTEDAVKVLRARRGWFSPGPDTLLSHACTRSPCPSCLQVWPGGRSGQIYRVERGDWMRSVNEETRERAVGERDGDVLAMGVLVLLSGALLNEMRCLLVRAESTSAATDTLGSVSDRELPVGWNILEEWQPRGSTAQGGLAGQRASRDIDIYITSAAAAAMHRQCPSCRLLSQLAAGWLRLSRSLRWTPRRRKCMALCANASVHHDLHTALKSLQGDAEQYASPCFSLADIRLTLGITGPMTGQE